MGSHLFDHHLWSLFLWYINNLIYATCYYWANESRQVFFLIHMGTGPVVTLLSHSFYLHCLAKGVFFTPSPLVLISDTPSCMRWWLMSLNLGGINTEQPGSISPSCTTPRQRTIYLWLHKNGFLLDDDSLKGYIYVHLKEFEIFYPQLLCGQKPESKRNWTQLGKFCRSHQIGKTFAKTLAKSW